MLKKAGVNFIICHEDNHPSFGWECGLTESKVRGCVIFAWEVVIVIVHSPLIFVQYCKLQWNCENNKVQGSHLCVYVFVIATSIFLSLLLLLYWLRNYHRKTHLLIRLAKAKALTWIWTRPAGPGLPVWLSFAISRTENKDKNLRDMSANWQQGQHCTRMVRLWYLLSKHQIIYLSCCSQAADAVILSSDRSGRIRRISRIPKTWEHLKDWKYLLSQWLISMESQLLNYIGFPRSRKLGNILKSGNLFWHNGLYLIDRYYI